jgi:glutathione S-transferase
MRFKRKARTMLTLYSMPSSGNSYKVRLILAKLGIRFKHIAAEYGSGVTTSDAFRAMNPNGKVPLLQLEDGRLLAESNAILLYLADGTRFVPEDRYARAKAHEWMFFEQNYHEGTVAVRAAVLTYPHRASARTPENLANLLEGGHRALGVMEAQLGKTPYLAGESFTVADICLYAYTHSAGAKGGFEMARFPHIVEWLARCAEDPGHVPLEWGTD